MRVLFVSYGGGHIEMCLPVMRALRQLDSGCELQLMALTTGLAVASTAGETPLGYRDFCDPEVAEQIDRYGRELLEGSERHPAVSEQESIAYLGINFLELVDQWGEAAAFERWEERGRQSFLPVRFFKRVLTRIQPDVVVTTNSPRSEQAAVMAAVELGIPSLSMLDLFALPGDPFLQRMVYADRLTVLSEATRRNLITAGFDEDRLFVTGNPAFDVLMTPQASQAGRDFRRRLGWEQKNIVLWAGHLESPDAVPQKFAGPGLALLVQDCLVSWVMSRSDVCLVVRYHPNEWHRFTPLEGISRVHWSQPGNEPLLPVLLASDQVLVQGTTVGAQAFIAGKRLLSMAFSPFVRSTGMDYHRLGMAESVVDLETLPLRLEEGLRRGRKDPVGLREQQPAATGVALNILALVNGGRS